MITHILVLIVGFVVLIKGADLFVDSASSLAQNFKLSKALIALTIVAFGTSAPELAVSIQAILNGSGDIVLGNVVGSNILNILLILGLASIVHPLDVKNNTVKKELPILLLTTLLLAILMSDNLFDSSLKNTFTRADGFVVLIFFSVFVYYLIAMMRGKVDEEQGKAKYGVAKSIIFTLLGLGAIVIGSDLVVESATSLAKSLGVSERIISLTIVAFGTSLPELVTSLTAARKGEYDIAIGNVVGSNIFNIGIVLGIPTAIFGGLGAITFNPADVAVMIGASFLLFGFAFKDRRLNRLEGVILFTLFLIYYSFILFV